MNGAFRKFKVFHLTLFLVIYGAVPTKSQEETKVDSIKYSISLDEITVLSKEKTFSPISFEKIKITENQISATERIDHYLNYIPGLEMQSGALNTNRIVIRGIGSRSPFATSKLRAYLDDIPITDGIGETNIEDINLESIDHIEIWKGPFRSAYGANLGGAIKYVSKNIYELDSYFQTENTIGDYGYYRTENTLTSKINDNSALQLNQEYIRSDGYRDNNDYRKLFTNGSYKYIGRNYSINSFLSHIDLNSQIPSSLNITDFENNPGMAASNWKSVEGYEDYRKTRIGINYLRALGTKANISSTLYGLSYNSYELRPFNILDDNSSAVSLRTRYSYLGDKSSFEIGQEFYFEKYKWQIFDIVDGQQGIKEEESDSDRTIINIFAEYNYDISSSFSIGSGVNMNYTSLTIEDKFNGRTTNNSYNPIVSPRLFLKYKLSNTFITRVDAAHGYSNPGIDESLNADGSFNELINQEKGWNYEGGFEWAPSNNFVLTASGFLMNVNDIIVNRQDIEGNIYGVNAGKTRHKGVEIQSYGNIIIDYNTKLNFNIGGEVGDYSFIDFVDGDNDYTGNELTGVANSKVYFKLLFTHYNTSMLLNFRSSGSIPVNDENSTYSDTYSVTGLKFNQDISLGVLSLALTAEIDNIFDTKYASMVAVNASSFGGSLPRYYYPGLPRNGKFTLKLKYNL